MKGHGVLLFVVLFAFGSLIVPGLCAGEMTYQETTVTLDQGIQGIVLEPKADSPVPGVLMLHGFGSQKDEVGNMYQRLAAALGDQGIASLRIDFRGWGDSAGKMEESRYKARLTMRQRPTSISKLSPLLIQPESGLSDLVWAVVLRWFRRHSTGMVCLDGYLVVGRKF